MKWIFQIGINKGRIPAYPLISLFVWLIFLASSISFTSCMVGSALNTKKAGGSFVFSDLEGPKVILPVHSWGEMVLAKELKEERVLYALKSIKDKLDDQRRFGKASPVHSVEYKSSVGYRGKNRLSRSGLTRKRQIMFLINKISSKYNVDPALVKAIVKAESGFRQYAVSRSGAKGLMQLMPRTARQLGVKNVFDPAQNIEGGVKYLRFLLKKFEGKKELAIAAYNAGPTKVKRLNRVPRIRETMNYVRKVLRYYKEYSREYSRRVL